MHLCAVVPKEEAARIFERRTHISTSRMRLRECLARACKWLRLAVRDREKGFHRLNFWLDRIRGR